MTQLEEMQRIQREVNEAYCDFLSGLEKDSKALTKLKALRLKACHNAMLEFARMNNIAVLKQIEDSG